MAGHVVGPTYIDGHCPICPDSFSNVVMLIEHANNKHFESISKIWRFWCGKCQKSFPSKTALFKHDHNFFRQILKCYFCQLTFAFVNDFVEHSNWNHLSEISKTWVSCEKCKEFFPSETSLKTHETVFHSDVNLITHALNKCCQFCFKTFGCTLNLTTHISEEHLDIVSKNWYPCLQCDNWFQTTEELSIHRYRKHTKTSKQKCQFCHNNFADIHEHHRLCIHKPGVTAECAEQELENEESTFLMDHGINVEMLIDTLLNTNQSSEDESNETVDDVIINDSDKIYSCSKMNQTGQEVEMVSKKGSPCERSKFQLNQNSQEEYLHSELDLGVSCSQADTDSKEFDKFQTQNVAKDDTEIILRATFPVNNQASFCEAKSNLDEPILVPESVNVQSSLESQTINNEDSILDEISAEIEKLAAQRIQPSNLLKSVCPICESEMNTSIELSNHVLAFHSIR